MFDGLLSFKQQYTKLVKLTKTGKKEKSADIVLEAKKVILLNHILICYKSKKLFVLTMLNSLWSKRTKSINLLMN